MKHFFETLSAKQKPIILLIIIYIGFISLGLPDTTLGVVWSSMRLDLNLPIYYAGILSTLLTCCSAISGFNSGFILRRLGTGKLLMICAFLTAFSLFGYATSSTFCALLLFTIPLGLGQGAIDAGMNYYVARHYTSRDMSWLHCSWGIGATTGPALITYILATGASWRWGYIAVATIQFMFAFLFLLSLKLWEHAPDKKENACVSTSSANKVKYSARFFSCMFMFFLYTGFETSFGLWGYTFLTTCRGISPTTAGITITLYWGMLTAGRFIVGIFANRLGNARQIQYGLFTAITGATLLFLDAPYLPLIALGILGFGLAPFYPAMMHATAERFDEVTAKTLTGFQCGSAMIGVAILPFSFGYLAQKTTFNILPYIGIGLAIVLLLLQFVVDGRTTKKSLNKSRLRP